MKKILLLIAAGVAVGVLALIWLLRMPDEAPDDSAAPARTTRPAPSALAKESPPASGAAPARELPAAPEPKEAPSADVERLLYGVISDERGEPVLDAQVMVIGGNPDAGNGIVRGLAFTGRGCYAIAGLQPGDWQVLVKADPDFCPVEAKVSFSSSADRQRADFTLRRHIEIPVFVTTSGGHPLTSPLGRQEVGELDLDAFFVVTTCEVPTAPLKSFVLPANRSSSSKTRLEESNDEQPRPFGSVTLLVPPPLYATLLYQGVGLATAQIVPGADRVEFTVTAEEFERTRGTLRLLLSADDPAAAVEPTKVRLEARPIGRDVPLGKMTHSEEGGFELGSVPLGRHLLRVQAKDRGEAEAIVDLEPGPNHIALVLPRATTITGRVQDAEGKPVAADIIAVSLDGAEKSLGPLRLGHDESWVAGADGSFAITGRAPGRHLLRARARAGQVPSASEPVVVDTRGSPGEVVLKLAPTTRVPLDYQGRGHSFVYGDIVDAHELQVWCDHVTPGLNFVDLLPGAYRLRLAEDGVKEKSVSPFSVGARAKRLTVPAIETDSKCALAPPEVVAVASGQDRTGARRLGCIVYGTLRGPWPPNTGPTLNVTVSSGSEKRQGTITAPDYALPGLEPGPARITISGAQISFEKQIDVPAGAGFHRLDLDVSSAAKPAR